MSPSPITIKDLFPEIPPERIQEVEEAFARYISLVLHAYERIAADPDLYQRFLSLTGLPPAPTIDVKGRSLTTKYQSTDV
jgi:hypothetical protein